MSYVLIVDDDTDAREAMAQFLEKRRYNVKSVPNGREALELVMNATPAVVVLDWMMPEMDGVDFLRIVRSYLRLQKLPVILVTAHQGEHIQQAREMNVRHVFHKANFELNDLVACVEELAPGTRR